MEYGCSNCTYTGNKQQVKRHLLKKTPCEGENPAICIEIQSSPLNCKYCQHSLKTKRTMLAHYKVCKVLKKDREAILEKIVKEQSAEIKDLKEQLANALTQQQPNIKFKLNTPTAE